MELLIGRKSLTLTLAFEEQSSDNVAWLNRFHSTSRSTHSQPRTLHWNLYACVAMITRTEIDTQPRAAVPQSHLPLAELAIRTHDDDHGTIWLSIKEPGELPGGADRCGHLLRHLDRTPPSLLVTDRRTFAPLSFFQNQNKCASTKHRSSPDQNKSMTPIES